METGLYTCSIHPQLHSLFPSRLHAYLLHCFFILVSLYLPLTRDEEEEKYIKTQKKIKKQQQKLLQKKQKASTKATKFVFHLILYDESWN